VQLRSPRQGRGRGGGGRAGAVRAADRRDHHLPVCRAVPVEEAHGAGAGQAVRRPDVSGDERGSPPGPPGDWAASWNGLEQILIEAIQRIPRDCVIGGVKDAIIARRGKEARNIARVAAARRLLTLVFYGMRDGQIRCLSRPPATQTAQAA
jgi:hypothetical protein